ASSTLSQRQREVKRATKVAPKNGQRTPFNPNAHKISSPSPVSSSPPVGGKHPQDGSQPHENSAMPQHYSHAHCNNANYADHDSHYTERPFNHNYGGECQPKNDFVANNYYG